MPNSRRKFLITSGAALGTAMLPAWVLEAEAAEAAAVDKERLAEAALSQARRLGASYADIRINRYRNELVAAREQQIQVVSRPQSFGFGVRVLVNGAWGFAASRDVTASTVQRMTRQAIGIARANAAYQRKPITLVPTARVMTTWKSAYRKDPFAIPLDDKIRFLLQTNEAAMKVPGASFVNSSLSFVNEEKFLASSDGSRIEQSIVRSYPFFSVTAVNAAGGDFQQRDSLAAPLCIGYEYLEEHDWIAEATRAAHEAVEKLKARPVEPGEWDLVLHPTHLWHPIHESIGHSTELDRALGWEANYAGTSFLTPDKAGRFRIGSPHVSFVADRTEPRGLATVGYDDDGVPAQRWHLVKEGVFVDWQTTRDLAAQVGRTSSYGCCHADSWGSVPFPRMPNVSLEPAGGNASLEDVLADVKRGILIYGNGSFSIDHQRYNFQFGGQSFWEIKDGKKGAMLRDVAYQARTPDFWSACDGLGGESTYMLGGAFTDGKGEPPQANAVSHGCPVARFRKIRVLNTGGRETGGGSNAAG